jgi:Na+-translocating ferredoxin:NAD+ oxidoreductase RnfD subunit
MNADATFNATALLYPTQSEKMRVFALGYFLSLLIIWNLLGHTVLGFEQSWAQLVAAVGAAVAAQIGFDWLDAKLTQRPFRLKKTPIALISFLAPALISGTAIGMLLFPNRLVLPFVFASVAAIASKVIFRAPLGEKTQHFFNPSNFAIVLTLFTCPWVSIAPPYHFMGHAVGVWNWIAPAIILLSGIVVHALATGRLPLVASWLFGFVGQALARHLIFGASIVSALLPMTSAAFIIFTLYMIPDPATTPLKPRTQVIFGLAVATLYGFIQASHQVYGLFGALFIISLIRGLSLYGLAFSRRMRNV